MPKFTTTYTFLFSAGLCLALSLGVAGAATGLKDRQEANERRDLQANILSALGLPEDGSTLTGQAVEDMYAERVKLVCVDADSEKVECTNEQWHAALEEASKAGEDIPELLPVFQRMDDGEPVKYAIYMEGKGLWGPIWGYVAIDPGATRILGTTFFAPKETPGLGYEITMDKFEDSFIDKAIVKGGETEAVDVVKGKAADICSDRLDYCVDGISGSTLTCNGVDAMVEDGLFDYDAFLQTLRAEVTP